MTISIEDVLTEHYSLVHSKDTCDLFKGRWVQDSIGSLYTNYSCKTIPFLRNCFLNGRKDTDFVHWRWKPDECELPRFGPGKFLTALRGKKWLS
ncbi:protein altered xyloglucan 4-like [Phtheirospermum japonicum]|uniref:Protein altered xyloglucan 4-like n=1 Tax=Phtheirospermum japonicum TaxID=374723 RepID=A0A830CIR5_9LAMI|nr:protein altered xyloglucan 4-like [Phtheirospermum japonicum]